MAFWEDRLGDKREKFRIKFRNGEGSFFWWERFGSYKGVMSDMNNRRGYVSGYV